MKEVYYNCPLCHRANFTRRGLRSHSCDKKPPLKPGRRGAPLTKAEWLAVVGREDYGCIDDPKEEVL